MEAQKSSSWAGAGVLLPSNSETATHPLDQLCALGSNLHEHWAEELFELTGIDNGFRQSGGLYVARSAGEIASLAGQELVWAEDGIHYELLKVHDLWERAPFLRHPIERAVWVPGESQIRNPDHLQALIRAIEMHRHSRVIPFSGNVQLKMDANQIVAVEIAGESIPCTKVCFCAGAWSGQILDSLGVKLPTTPVRGQMLLYKLDQPSFSCIVNEGPRYIVPRDDGHILVGSTMEEVGFDASPTPQGQLELASFAGDLIPELNELRPLQSWAGLRPASFDGMPYIGPVPKLRNAWIAAGHFRVGLQASPSTAVIIADLMSGQTTTINIDLFRPARVFQS
jgi:glycine oxidase